MKHSHAELIKQWLEDTTQEIEVYDVINEKWIKISILRGAINDTKGALNLRIKPNPGKTEMKTQDIEKQIIDLLDSYLQQEGAVKSLSNTFFYRIEWLKNKAKKEKQKKFEHITHAFKKSKKIEELQKNGEWERLSDVIYRMSYNDFCDFIINYPVSNFRIFDEYKEFNEVKKQKQESSKPPLGLKPKYVHDELRIREIQDAIERYNAVNKEVPKEWEDELNNLLNEYKIIDEYAHIRQALSDGKKIEFKHQDRWVMADINYSSGLDFNYDVDRYRIHDPYREIKEALKDGKRVVWKNSLGNFENINVIYEDYTPERYKIVDHDIIVNGYFVPISTEENKDMIAEDLLQGTKLKLTKCGITGKIKAEVVE